MKLTIVAVTTLSLMGLNAAHANSIPTSKTQVMFGIPMVMWFVMGLVAV